jgi:hypothetical protein
MNNTFSIQRFGLLLKRQWLEFGKIYLIILGVALGIIIAFYTFGLWNVLFEEGQFAARDVNFREPLFLIFGFLFISIIASSYYAHLGQKPKAIVDLLIPASTFEKFLSGLFFTAILSTISFLILFYIADLAFISKVKTIYESTGGKTVLINGKEVESFNKLEYFFARNWENAFLPVYVVPFFVTSIFLLGSVYFNKFHYIKTAIAVMIFSGIWSYIIFKSGEKLFMNRVPVKIHMDNFTQRDGEYLGVLLLSVLTLIFWSITYVRLKEKEV